MNGIRQHRKIAIKTILFLILSTSFLQPNYLGLSLKGVSGQEPEYKLNRIFEQTNLRTNFSILPADRSNDGNSFSIAIPTGVVVLMFLIFIIAPILSILWLHFLQDQPFEKQCLENNLFSDLIKLNNACVGIWSLLAFSFFIFEDSKDRLLLIAITKYFTLCNETIFFMLMVYLYLISSMRMYTAWFHVLDPLDNFFGEHERLSLMIIRFSILMISVIPSGILLFNSIQPILYYKFIDKTMKWRDIPHGAGILYGIDIALFALCAILFAVGRIYQWVEKTKHMTNILGSSNINLNLSPWNRANVSNEPNQESSTIGQDSDENNWHGRREVALPNILYLVTGVLMTTLILLQCMGVISLDIWWSVTAIVGMQGVMFPTLAILWYHNLRRYCFRQIRNYINRMHDGAYRLFYSNYISRNAIHPIE